MHQIKPDKGQEKPLDPVTPLDLSRIFDKYALPPDQKPVPERRPGRIKALLSLLGAMVRRQRPRRHTKP